MENMDNNGRQTCILFLIHRLKLTSARCEHEFERLVLVDTQINQKRVMRNVEFLPQPGKIEAMRYDVDW